MGFPEAIIFDFDDTIVDTAKLKFYTYQKVLAKHAIQITEEEYVRYWNETGSGVRHILAENKNKIDLPTFNREGSSKYLELLKTKLKPIPGALETLDYIKIKRALASNSRETHVAFSVDRLKIRDKFDVIVTGSDVKRGKPDPEIYQTAANLLGIQAKNCIAVDDHIIGIRSAKAAGMTTVAIPHGYSHDQDFSEADYVLKSIRDVLGLISF